MLQTDSVNAIPPGRVCTVKVDLDAFSGDRIVDGNRKQS